MTRPRINTPRGSVFVTKNGKAKLEFDTKFQRKWQSNYTRSQMFVDNEVLRLSEPFIPLLTSMLIKSGILGTEIGSGLVQWIAPYAAAQYYRAKKRGIVGKLLARSGISYANVGSQTGPLRGPFWFERMKAIHRNRIVSGGRRIAGGGR